MTNLERDHGYIKHHIKKTRHAGHSHQTTEDNTHGIRQNKRKTIKKEQGLSCHDKTLQDEEIFEGDRTFYSIITIRDERWRRTTTKVVTALGEIVGTKINKATCRLRYESP